MSSYETPRADLHIGAGLVTGMLAIHNAIQTGRAEDKANRSAVRSAVYGARLHNEVGRRFDAEQELKAERRRVNQLEDELAIAYEAIGILQAKLAKVTKHN